MQPISEFYLRQKEPNRSCLLALRQLILEQDCEVSETTKYGMPCFCFKNKMFCYLWVDKKSTNPYVLFVEGKYLEHPKLEKGGRARMKTFLVDPNQDLPHTTLVLLIKAAIDLYKAGVIKIK